jgi:hypothetical protein
MDSHSLLHCTFNVIFTWGFTVQDINWKCSARDVENWYAATNSEISNLKQVDGETMMT